MGQNSGKGDSAYGDSGLDWSMTYSGDIAARADAAADADPDAIPDVNPLQFLL